MKKLSVLIISLILAFNLYGQENRITSLINQSKMYVYDQKYNKADSVLKIALGMPNVAENLEFYKQLAIVSKLIGDTCQYCKSLNHLISNNEFQAEYSKNCIDTIWKIDSISKSKSYLLKPKCKLEEKEVIKSDQIEKIEPYTFVEQMPEFVGGEEALMLFLKNNISYPDEAKEKGIKGTVYVTFIVDVDGKLLNPEILKGPHYLLNNEVLRVVNKMPKWHPGRIKGKPVPVQFNLPIKFLLP
ncbi:MAG: energy transducer TonB [Bacteroidetes bacterium]|nr:energy transducer TonB [Bacteroidota bacterium]